MAIQHQIWAKDIAEALFPSSSFVTQAINDDGFVQYKTVTLPQAGALPEVVKNRTTIPATASKRTDGVVEYSLDSFTSSPTVIQDIEEVETSYNKRQSVLRDHQEELAKQCANWLLYNWAGSNIIRTDGDDRTANTPNATGNRKQLTLNSFFEARRIMDDQDVPMEGRCVLLPAHMYNDLIENNKTELLRMDHTGRARYTDGNLEALLGFTIYQRGKNNVLRFSNAGSPVKIEPSTTGVATDNAAALFWQNGMVRRAKGQIKTFSKLDDPNSYGSIFSAEVRVGGSKKYTDGRGIVTLIEAAGS